MNVLDESMEIVGDIDFFLRVLVSNEQFLQRCLLSPGNYKFWGCIHQKG